MIQTVLSRVKIAGAATLQYLGDAAHRRFVAVAVAMIATKIVGHNLAADDVANGINLLIGGLGGAWSRTTPKIDVDKIAAE